jgi:hypothetical protein
MWALTTTAYAIDNMSPSQLTEFRKGLMRDEDHLDALAALLQKKINKLSDAQAKIAAKALNAWMKTEAKKLARETLDDPSIAHIDGVVATTRVAKGEYSVSTSIQAAAYGSSGRATASGTVTTVFEDTVTGNGEGRSNAAETLTTLTPVAKP